MGQCFVTRDAGFVNLEQNIGLPMSVCVVLRKEKTYLITKIGEKSLVHLSHNNCKVHWVTCALLDNKLPALAAAAQACDLGSCALRNTRLTGLQWTVASFTDICLAGVTGRQGRQRAGSSGTTIKQCCKAMIGAIDRGQHLVVMPLQPLLIFLIQVILHGCFFIIRRGHNIPDVSSPAGCCALCIHNCRPLSTLQPAALDCTVPLQGNSSRGHTSGGGGNSPSLFKPVVSRVHCRSMTVDVMEVHRARLSGVHHEK